MVGYQFIVYLEPYRESHFYKTLENFLLSSLAYYGLHEGAMAPPHCDMTQFLNKGNDSSLPITRVVTILDKLVKAHSPLIRPHVESMMPVNDKVVRENLLCIPLNLVVKGIGGIVHRPYQRLMKEFRYETFKHFGITVVPGKMVNLPLVYNNDKILSKNKRLSRKEMQMLWDLAHQTIDFQDAQKCAWHCTFHQVQKSMYFDRHHLFFERPVKTWEVAREIIPQKKWLMDWP